MSKIALEGNASGTGTFTIASPNSNSNYTLTLPTASGTVVTTGGAQTIEFAAGTAAAPSITFTGDTNTGIFSPAADTIAFAEGGAEAMRIDSSGNLGLGVTPSAWGGTKAIDVGTYTALADIAANSVLYSNAYYNGTNTVYKNSALASYYNQVSGQHIWATAASGTAGNTITFTERMRIDSSGNVGIGITADNPIGNGGTFRNVLAGNGAGYAAFQGVTTATASGSTVVAFSGGTTGASGAKNAASINIELDGTSTTNATGRIAFYTGSGGSTTERARITSGGYFKASNSGTYVGSTGSYHETVSNSASDAVLVVESTSTSYTNYILSPVSNRNTTNNSYYAIGYYHRGATAYKFLVADSGNVTNTNGSYGTISDLKLKQDIVDAGSQWDDIKNLRFRKYRLKADVEANPDAKPLLGLVAQEAELVSPGLIEEHRDTKQETKTREIPAVLDEEGNEVEPAKTEEYTETVDLGTTTKSIKTSILYMKAVKALQEAMTRIEALEAEVAALKGQ